MNQIESTQQAVAFLKKIGNRPPITYADIKPALFAKFRAESETDIRTNGVGAWFAYRTASEVGINIKVDQVGDATVETRWRKLAAALEQLSELHEAGIVTDEELDYGTNYWLDHYEPTIALGWDSVAYG